MKTPNRGQHKKNGYEVLYDSFKQTQAPRRSSSQQTSEYEAKVVEVIVQTDPNVETQASYYVIARRIEEDENVPEPVFYEKSYISDINIIGLKKYYPASGDLEIPQVGQLIRVSFRSSENIDGVYLGVIGNIKKTDLVGSVQAQTGENSPSNSFGDQK